MTEQAFNQRSEDEISLRDITDFLVEFWRLIFLAGLLGVVTSVGYLIVTPYEYQATAQIQLAEISVGNKLNNSGKVHVEDPNLLIARLKMPTSYSVETIKGCGFENLPSSAEDLVSILNFTIIKNVESIIEISITRDSKEAAIACAQHLFENIKSSQSQIIKLYVEELKVLLIKYEARLSHMKNLTFRRDKAIDSLSVEYLANRDEVNFLTQEVYRLNALITSANLRQAKLVAPIYAKNAPVFPKKRNSLIIGLVAGLSLGCLFAVFKTYFKSSKLLKAVPGKSLT